MVVKFGFLDRRLFVSNNEGGVVLTVARWTSIDTWTYTPASLAYSIGLAL